MAITAHAATKYCGGSVIYGRLLFTDLPRHAASETATAVALN